MILLTSMDFFSKLVYNEESYQELKIMDYPQVFINESVWRYTDEMERENRKIGGNSEIVSLRLDFRAMQVLRHMMPEHKIRQFIANLIEEQVKAIASGYPKEIWEDYPDFATGYIDHDKKEWGFQRSSNKKVVRIYRKRKKSDSMVISEVE